MSDRITDPKYVVLLKDDNSNLGPRWVASVETATKAVSLVCIPVVLAGGGWR